MRAGSSGKISRPTVLFGEGWLLRLLFSFAAALTLVLGMNISAAHSFLMPHENPHAALYATLLAILLATAAIFLLSRCLRSPFRREIRRSLNPKVFFAAVFLSNLLLLLGYFPGTQSWDTWSQLIDFFDGTSTSLYLGGSGAMVTAALNDHHPVLTTLLFGSFASLGRWMGQEELGVFLYSLLQIALYAWAYTRAVVYYDRRRGLSRRGVALFYLLNPFLAYYAIMMLKDSLFSLLFLLYFLDLVRIWRKEEGKTLFLRFAALSLLLPLTRKTGIYIVLLSNVFLLFRWKGGSRPFRLAVVSSVLCPFLLSFILLPRIVFPACNIYPGGRQEVLGTLLQQSARTGLDHPEACSEEEKALLNRVFDYDAVPQKYDYLITDPVKDTYRLNSVTDQDLKDYLGLWFRTGLKYPGSYLAATADCCAGYFAPSVPLEVYRVNHTWELTDLKYFVILREIAEALYDFLLRTPGINLFLYMVVYTWWIPLICTFRVIRRRGWRSLGFLAPVWVSVLTLIVSPYSFSRYALPFVVIAPLLLCEARETSPVLSEAKEA